MQELKATHNNDEDTISPLDVARFIKTSHKKILLFGFFGLVTAVCFPFLLGQYTASITLMNYAQIDIPRIKYLQAALPRLSQEESVKGSENYLGSEELWKSAINLKSLVGKSDVKDMLDPASLQSDRFNIYAIEVLGKANTKKLAEERAQEISNYFTLVALSLSICGIYYGSMSLLLSLTTPSWLLKF
jgi:predicted PurR-regulated permease PerM